MLSGSTGRIYFRDKFVLEEDFIKSIFFDLKETLDNVISYSRLRISLNAGRTVELSQTDLADNGFIKWIAVKVAYPEPANSVLYGAQTPIIPGLPTLSNGTAQTDKYIYWEYRGKTYNVGELMILSGSNVGTSDSEKNGWNLSKDALPYADGGILFTNPHSDIDVKLEILVAR